MSSFADERPELEQSKGEKPTTNVNDQEVAHTKARSHEEEVQDDAFQMATGEVEWSADHRSQLQNPGDCRSVEVDSQEVVTWGGTGVAVLPDLDRVGVRIADIRHAFSQAEVNRSAPQRVPQLRSPGWGYGLTGRVRSPSNRLESA